MKSFSIKHITLMVSMFTVIITIDQVAKYFAITNLSQSIPVCTFFSLTLTFNKGISFGIFNSAGQQQQILISIAVAIIISLLLMLTRSRNTIVVSAIVMIISGATGNIIDRIFFGAVVDFLDFHYAEYYFPVFNVADIAICVGSALMMYGEYKLQSNQQHSKNTKQ